MGWLRQCADTAGASEIVFALAWALGYRWAPRRADLPDQRLWRIDRDAHYGSLNGLARHRINTRLIAEHWDEICRLTASLRAGTVVPSAILRTLQRGPSPSSLARALAELGRVIKPCTCSNTPTTRPIAASSTTCSAAGNAATPSPGMSSTASAARSGGTTRSGRKNQLDSLGIMINVVVLWQTVYTQAALDHLAASGYSLDPADVARLTPVGHPTINLDGRYRTTSRPPATGLRPLRID